MRRCLVLMMWLLLTATTTAAQSEAQRDARPPVIEHRTPDFLFGRPAGTLSVRGGWIFARGQGDWFDFITDELTLARRDFNTPSIAADVGFAVAPRIDILAGVEFGQASADSEYRHLVDNNRLPIEQHTRLRRTSVTGSAKIALTERGRQIGSLVWIPKTVVPYLGAGGGATWYDLRQAGDFVDFVDNSVFTDVFRSRGWAPTAHVFGGVDIKLARRLFATLQGRYVWAKSDLGADWIDFTSIDLSGFQLSTGVNILF